LASFAPQENYHSDNDDCDDNHSNTNADADSGTLRQATTCCLSFILVLLILV
jgi:hypothetical protein